MADISSLLPTSVPRNLADKLLEKHKNVSLEVEGVVRMLTAAGHHEMISILINVLTNEFSFSPQENHRKGSLIGFAVAIVVLATKFAQQLEVEGVVRMLTAVGEHEKMSILINVLTNEFSFSPQENHQKGGLIGFAIAIVGLATKVAQHLEVSANLAGTVEDASKVQTLLFNATMPDWVKKFASRFLKHDKKIVDLVGDDKIKASRSLRHIILPYFYSAREQVIPDG